MINPLNIFRKSQRPTFESYITELPYETQLEAKSIVKPGMITSYEFVNSDGSSSVRTVRVVNVDYARNRVTLEYLKKSQWIWVEVPIFDNLPML